MVPNRKEAKPMTAQPDPHEAAANEWLYAQWGFWHAPRLTRHLAELLREREAATRNELLEIQARDGRALPHHCVNWLVVNDKVCRKHHTDFINDPCVFESLDVAAAERRGDEEAAREMLDSGVLDDAIRECIHGHYWKGCYPCSQQIIGAIVPALAALLRGREAAAERRGAEAMRDRAAWCFPQASQGAAAVRALPLPGDK
jgi:hypothetical protein